VLEESVPSILDGLGAVPVKRLGQEFHFVQLRGGRMPKDAPAADFVRWNLPVEHAWPCHPEKMAGFVEKAAEAIERKFGPRAPQGMFAGPLDPSATNRYYKSLASNLRGRTLQLLPPATAALRDPEMQDPELPTLYCLVGKEGLFCGMQSPREGNGFYPGGTKFIGHDAATISRAGAKIAEALHYLRLHRLVPPPGSHWLELGASPGGMTAELLARDYQVTAVDRAPLDPRLAKRDGLTFVQTSAAEFQPKTDARFDALLSDMNGDPRHALREVSRLARTLHRGCLVIFTLKMAGANDLLEMQALVLDAVTTATKSGLELVAKTHLSYNRRELTLIFETVR
jgi:23S rRNA (cytidine2498-2'-O)-methyltransferase